jgi:hypothetical protein
VKRPLIVDPFSLPSLLIQPCANGNVLSSATGFAVIEAGSPHLVTNLHVVTGRDTETDRLLSQTGAVPDALRIFHHSALVRGQAGAWCVSDEPLFTENGAPRWLAHPARSIKDTEHPTEYDVDIAALPLLYAPEDAVALHPVDLSWADADVLVAPGLPVSIIGYPFGRAGGGFFPIWKTGHVASDPDAHWSGRYFLVDATTREGMSGSPVLYRSPGMYQRSDGAIILGAANRLMGIYSGRIQDNSEIGIVWQPQLIREVVTQQAEE